MRNTVLLPHRFHGRSKTGYCLLFLLIYLGTFAGLKAQSRQPSKDFNTLDVKNNDATGLWSDGTTMWVANTGFLDDKLYAYNLATKVRDAAKDFNTLIAAGNGSPAGIWSDDITMWVADISDNKLYAYNLATKTRDAAKEINTLIVAGNISPTGIWSHGTTMWVADLADEKIYAYNLSTKARDAAKDFNTLSAAGNEDPYGIWSDGTTMWVGDISDDKLYAYNLSTKARDAVKDFSILSASGNTSPIGIWSDGTTMWVADNNDDKLYAYNLLGYDLVSSVSLSSLPSNFSDARSVPLTLNVTVTNAGVKDAPASTTLRYYRSSDPTIEPGTDMELRVESVPVLGGEVERTYSLDISTPTTAGDYYYAVCVDEVTGEALTGNNCSEVKRVHVYTPLEESQRMDFNTLSAAGNDILAGIWSDGTTMWVTDLADDKLYAYNLATKMRDAAKDFNTLSAAGNDEPTGIWSDGTTMWVGDPNDAKLYAYNLATKARDAAKDFNILDAAGNNGLTGIWSDGSTMWVSDLDDAKLYAYNLATKMRDAANDFNTLSAAGNDEPTGIWSDGTIMWVSDFIDAKLYAYNLVTKARDAAKDFNTLITAESDDTTGIMSDGSPMIDTADILAKGGPTGIWSDGITMWVADLSDAKLYAYILELRKRNQALTFTLSKTTYKVSDAAVTLSATTDATGLTNFTFSSSDPSVAVVNDDQLTFVGVGNALITATQAGDAGYAAGSDSVEITVNKGIQVVTFTLSETTYKVSDASVILSASTDATGLTDFIFRSSAPGVAEVNGNELSFISPGTAKIIATQAGDVNYISGSDSVDITVNKGVQVVTFTLSQTTYKVSDAAVTLSASTDATGLMDFTFSSSDHGVAEVNDNQLTFVSPGTAKIIATQAGNANYTAGSDSIEITVNKGIQVVTFTLSKTTYKIGDAAITLSASTDISTGLTGFILLAAVLLV